ncbi:MAG: hypothetical protein NTU43_05860 [Bacteroidetes bacterium]|nr:hypothetical protein [Bacteroidota bacterium]
MIKIENKFIIALMNVKRNYVIFFFLFATITVFGQDEKKYTLSNKIIDINIGYNYQIPSADLINRFGNFNSIYVGASLKTRNQWFISTEANYMFGPEIKEINILNNVSNSSGIINDENGNPGKYAVGMRGYGFYARLGKIFPISRYNKNSGIIAMIGVGYMFHWINFNTPQDNIKQLGSEYQKGYDRLTAGYTNNLFLGYLHHAQNRLVNFYVGLDMINAYTQSVRGYNFDERKRDEAQRLDQIFSLRFGWLIPIYLNSKDENEFDYK